MKIGEILEDSFNLPWKNRFLIFYGAVIALLTGGYGLSNNLNYTLNSEELAGKLPWLANEAVVIIFSILVITLAILGFLISIWAGAAIVQAVSLIREKKKTDWREAGKVGKRKMFRLLGLSLFLPFLIFLALILIAIPLVYLFTKMPQPTGLVTGVIVGAIVLLLLIPALIYLGLTWALAIRFIILEDSKVLESVKQGLNLIKGHFWRTFGFAILFSLVAGAGSAAASIPLLLLGGSSFFAFMQNNISVGSGIAILTVLYYVIYLAIVGYFQAFIQVGWTLWWFRLRAEQAERLDTVKTPKAKPVPRKAAPKKPKK